ncbi:MULTISPECIES: class I adenylate-forming enzyme family protein [Pseudonocardia]|uniref:Plipastatin synthase subunit A n=2 Tax=Pseudonocardia TaxID=1847 RepID=A0A1Y2N6M2_PSEAH|nr:MULTISPECIES: AMP-binding protein [Pseudonocardia]OSY42821.1 Plipastatin synthase subunit A [Pseudonocardia autotrophica]TDN77398.1 amino acid adenylation domain-containing protein [Pseudonocardia autotrophica]BBG01422.1 AMP-dependent ligase [Pseudonocardia autotrophica]GEC24478.1 AMP-dependent ligase [Pseudonocardia saturnea]
MAPVSAAHTVDAGSPAAAPASGIVCTQLDDAARRSPAAVAVRDATGVWTYAELDAAATALAHRLHDLGIRPGDRVAMRSRNRREVAAVLFGVLRAGATLVPLSPHLTAAGLAGVLADAGPGVLVTDRANDDTLGVPVLPMDLIRPPLDPLTGSRIDTGTGTGPAPDDIALLIYTSGSTSAPKGVVSPHRAVDFAARSIAARLGYRSDDVVLVGSPMSFDYGLYQLFLTTLAGAELVLTDAEDPIGMLRTLRGTRATVVPIVPSTGRLMVRLARRGDAPEHVRLFTNTGAALTLADIQELRSVFPNAAVVAMYGITECKRVTIAEPDVDRERPGSVGRAIPGTTVQILDDDGSPLGPDLVGEIAAVGPHVMAGYRNAPELSAQRFDRDPLTGAARLRTGDYGRLDADGHLYFHGRRDDQFKRRGVRMSLIEIEAAAAAVTGVRAAAAVPPVGDRDLELVAVTDRSPEEVLAGIAELLEPAKVPVRCHVVHALPLTPNGKTDRAALLAPREGDPA